MDKLQKELAFRKSQEDHLLQVIDDLKSSQSQVTPGHFGDEPFMNAEGASGSPSSESLDENVKDAQIKHLRRQILKYNYNNTEGLANRLCETVKERDTAVDELSKANEESDALREQLVKLKTSYFELQQKLHRTQQDLGIEGRHERCQSHSAKLQEELNAEKTLLQPLKESLGRLSHENRLLKDATAASQSAEGQKRPQQQQQKQHSSLVSSTVCNQELEYLHRVVDTLKNTVLEQRNVLMQMKSPESSQTGIMSSMLGCADHTNSIIAPGPSSALQNQMIAMSKSTGLLQPVVDTTQMPLRTPTASQAGHPPTGLIALSPRLTPNFSGTEQFTDFSPQMVGHYVKVGMAMRNNGHSNDAMMEHPQHPVSNSELTQAMSGNPGAKKLQLQPQLSAPVRKRSQSEVMARRASIIAPAKIKSISETISRQPVKPALESKKLPQWVFTSGQCTTGDNLAHFHTAIPQQLPVGGISYEAAAVLADVQEAYPPMSTAQFQQQKIFHPPAYNQGAVRVINYDGMSGGCMTPQNAGSPSHPVGGQGHTGSQESGGRPVGVWQNDMYANTSVAGRSENMSSQHPSNVRTGVEQRYYESEVNPSHSQLSGDRICPVCNKNYAKLSMEDFQTHVFECFDDENAPETMKPIPDSSRSDRLCPMCNTRFSQSMPQTDFEKHVHNHFVEELPGENFEIIQP